MLGWIMGLIRPPVFEGDEQKTRAAGLLNTVVLAVLGAAILGFLVLAIAGQTDPGVLEIFGAVGLVFTVMLVLLRYGLVRLVGILVPLVLWAGFSVPVVMYDGIRDGATIGYFVVVLISGLVADQYTLLAFVGLTIVTAVGVYGAEVSGWIAVSFDEPAPISDVVILVVSLATSGLLLRGVVGSIAAGFEQARQSARALARTNEELAASRDALFLQASAMERRSRYLEAAASVARDAATLLDPQDLLARVVSMVSEQFGFYHAGVFLLDESRQWAELRAASSAGGQRMLARGHRLRVGEQGIVGWAAQQGEYRIALDVGADAVFFDNPDLPETRSEAALPLHAHGEVLGVLDVQSREAQAFSDEDVGALQSLADQVAVALTNARLFQQVEASLEAERRTRGELTREAWTDLMRERPDLGFLSDTRGTVPAGDLWDEEMVAAVQTGETVTGEGDARSVALAVPVKTRGQVVGVIDAHLPDDGGEWTPEQRELLETLAEQLGIALESAQLYQDAQRRAAREQVTREVTDRMRSAIDMDELLQTAIRETASVLGASRAFVQWVPSAQVDDGDERTTA